jgi:head-tail adaptor
MFRGLSARTLAKVQQNVNVMLTDSCTIERETSGVGAMGEDLHENEVVASNVPCRLIRAGLKSTGSSNIVGGRESLLDRFRLILPVGTDVSADYRVRMADETIYQVVDVEAALTDATFVAAVIMRVRGRNG